MIKSILRLSHTHGPKLTVAFPGRSETQGGPVCVSQAASRLVSVFVGRLNAAQSPRRPIAAVDRSAFV